MFRSLTLLCTAAAVACSSAAALAQTPRFLQRTADEWTAQLKSAKPADRRNAAFALGKLANYAASALPELKQLYADEQDVRAREAIVLAVGEIAAGTESVDPAVESTLIDALQRDPDKLVRRSAALALRMVGSKSEKVQTALSHALSDPAQEVRQNAAWALGRFDARVAPALVGALKDATCDSLVKRDAADALAAVGRGDPSVIRPAIDALLAMCSDKGSEVRKAALAPLTMIVSARDTQAVPVLKAALRDPDAEVRRFAALALSNVGGTAAAEAVPILRDALQHGELYLKRSAAFAMHNIRATAAPAVPDLVHALRDPDDQLRKYAAMALGKIGKAAGPAVVPLVQLVKDTALPADVRVQAAEALTEMGDLPEIRKQIPELLNVLGNAGENGDVRARLAWLFNPFFENISIMEAAKPTMESVCAESATKDNGMARYQCAYLLGLRFTTKASDAVLNVLQEWLYDNTGKIYSGQTTKVGASGTERSGENQQKLNVIGDSRSMAVQALGLVGRDRVLARKEIVEQLRQLAKDRDTVPSLQKDVRTLLQKLGA